MSELTETPTPTTDTDASLPHPRIRTGAVLWGLVLSTLGAWALWIAVSDERRAAFLETVLTATPLAWTVVVVVAVGGFITLLALAAVIRRGQRHLAARGR